ncbi:MAG: putative LPS assembly protein LptD [Ignavibacteria bacterium]
MNIKPIIIFLLCTIMYCQNADTLSTVNADTLASTVPDSLSKNKNNDIDDVVFASSSDSLFFDIRNKKMFVYGSGKLKYKETELNSGLINVNFQTNDLEAFGVKDTADTTWKKLMDTPVLTEAGETYNGNSIKYNFKTQRGFISVAKNDKGDSRYEGAKVKKVDKDIYFIEDGIYTTCPQDPPHTHFYAKKMKVIQKDKVIAKWVFMFIAGVPVPLPIPFAVFPTEAGRRSGAIIPSYGSDADRGSYFRNFGYFFALSDYYDLALTGDYYTKGGYGIHSRVRYKKRYEFDGSISFNYSKETVGEVGDPDRSEVKDWNLSVYHNQKFNPTTSLDVNLQFQSGSYYKNNSTNYTELLSKNITSNATLSKRWDESGNSLTINYYRNQNLESGDITEYLPNITFNKKLVYPFKRETTTNTSDQLWYEYISYSYSAKLKNRRKRADGELEINNGVQHNVSLSASPKLGYFNISPSISYEELWYPNRIQKENFIIENEEDGEITREDSVVDRKIDELSFVRTFSLSLSANTKLYGIWQPNIFGIEAFRHTLTPTISYNYTPDFSDEFWGYYDSYTDKDGNKVKYDKFDDGIFGGASSGESQRINFSLGNVFEMKTAKDPTDTSSQQQKIQLLNLTASSSYDFAKDSLNLGNLSLSYRTQIGDLLNLRGSSTYTFYDYQNGSYVNDFLVSKGKGLFRMTNFSFSASTTLSGEKIQGEERNGESQQDQQQADDEDDGLGKAERTDYISDLEKQESDFTIPWNLSLDFNYSISKSNPLNVTRSSDLGFSLGMNLTKNWKVTLRGSYDIENDEISAPSVTMYRDLGCWEVNFSWNPLGQYRGYTFNIRMKAPELQDIKVDKSGGIYSGF